MFYADQFCKYSEHNENGVHHYVFSGPCILTGKPVSVKVVGSDLFRYRRGALIQDAFPYLTDDEREFLLSGCYFVTEDSPFAIEE